jgi:hypothetical protein
LQTDSFSLNGVIPIVTLFLFVWIQKETEASVAKNQEIPKLATLKQRNFGWTPNLSNFSNGITIQYFKKEVAV